MCGAKRAVTARVPEVLATVDVPLLVVDVPREKKGNVNGALAKLPVRRNQRWRKEGAGAASR